MPASSPTSKISASVSASVSVPVSTDANRASISSAEAVSPEKALASSSAASCVSTAGVSAGPTSNISSTASCDTPLPSSCGPLSRCASGRLSSTKVVSSARLPSRPQIEIIRLIRDSRYCSTWTIFWVRWPVRSWNEQAIKISVARASMSSQLSSSAPFSRSVQAVSWMASAAARISCVALSVLVTMASSSFEASMKRLPSSCSCLMLAISRLVRSIASCMSAMSRRMRSMLGTVRSRTMTFSSRAMASSTICVSGFWFRRMYSSRNQRPRSVSVKAFRSAS